MRQAEHYAGIPLLIVIWSVAALAQPAVESPPGATIEEAAVSEPASDPVPLERPFDLLNNSRLAGDWWGGRRWIEDRGIEFSLSLTSVYQHNARGGLRTHNGHRIAGSVDWELILDTEALGLWQGGTLYTGAESSWNDDLGGDLVGNHFGTNADAVGDNSIVVNELWYEHLFLNGKVRFKVGKLDPTVDLDTNAYANDETAQFLNPALVNTGNIPLPDYGLGAVLVVQPTHWSYIGVGSVDAQANGRETGFQTTFHGEDYFFSAAEIGFLPEWNTPWGKLPGGYRFGVWYDPQPKECFFDDLGGRRITVPMKRDDVGFYFNMDQLLIKEKPQDDTDQQGLGMFFRYGYAHQDANPVEHFWSVGGQYQGLVPTRDDDVLGFGVSQGILSEQLRFTGVTPHRETVLELYYRIVLTPWLSISPDFQWILDPGGVLTTADSYVAGLRVQASF